MQPSMQDTEFILGGFTLSEPAPAPPAEPAKPTPAMPDPPAPAEPQEPQNQDPPADPPKPAEPASGPEKIWFNLAKSFQATDKLLPEDVEIPEDLDGPAFKELILGVLEKEAASKIDAEAIAAEERKKLLAKGWTAEQIEEGLRIAEGLVAGVEPAEVQEVRYYEQLQQYVPQSNEERIEYVRRMYLANGQDPGLVEAYLQREFGDTEDPDRDNKLAQAEAHARKGFEALKTQRVEAMQAAAQERQEQLQREMEEERKGVERAIEAGMFGVKLDKQAKADLLKAMYETDSYEVIEGPEGSQRVPLTRETKAIREMFRNPEKRAVLAYIAVYGVENFVNLASRKATDGFLKAIASQETPRPSTQAPSAPPVMPNPADRVKVGEGTLTIPFST